jgi:hypothetical protein
MRSRRGGAAHAVVLATVPACSAVLLMAQSCRPAAKGKQASKMSGDEYPDVMELDPFGEVSLYAQPSKGATGKAEHRRSSCGRECTRLHRVRGVVQLFCEKRMEAEVRAFGWCR